MSLFANLIDGIESALYATTRSLLLSSAPSYCQMETAAGGSFNEDSGERESPHVITTKQGSCMSVFQIQGINRIMPSDIRDETLLSFTEDLARTLAPFLKRNGHHFEFVFQRDPDATVNEIEDALVVPRATLKKLNLNLQTMLDGRVKELKKFCSTESVYLVCYTHLTTLSSAEIKEDAKIRQARAKEAGYTPGDYGSANFYSLSKAIYTRHATMEQTLAHKLNACGIVLRTVNAHEFVNHVRRTVDPLRTSRNWRPQLPGDRVMPKKNSQSGLSYFPQSLSMQITPADLSCEGNLVKSGDLYFATGMIDVGQQEVESFASLFQTVDRTIPWRLSIAVHPNGMDFHSINRKIVAFLGFLTESSKTIKQSFDYIDAMKKEGVLDLGVKINFQTWGMSEEQTKMRFSLLNQAVQGWGMTDTADQYGDPFLGFFSCIPGYSNMNGATALVPPILEATKMLPLTRPASPWPDGSIVYRTDDGMIFRYAPGSNLSDTWIDFFMAPPGSGKSNTMNALNLACFMTPGLTDLPYMFVLDIGVSSAGVIELIQQNLPESKRHQAIYKRVQNNVDWAVNPFDTQPGMRYPTDQKKAYQKTLLMIFCTPIGEGMRPYEGTDSLADMVIDEMYRFYDDHHSPKPYRPNIDPQVDECVLSVQDQIPQNPTWWEITDILWENGFKHESTLAQRYAMPTMNDVARVCNLPSIREVFCKANREVRISTGEFLTDAMSRLVTQAMSTFPALSTTTRLDLGDVRVVSLDLQDVAPKGGPAEQRQSAVFYLFAMSIFTDMTYLNSDIVQTWLPKCPDIYHEHHIKKAEVIEKYLKTLSVDELHRSGKIPAFRETFLQILREGRKFRTRAAAASQFLGDFDNDMLDAATAIYVMKYQDDKTSAELKARIGFSDTALRRFKNECHGPRPGYGAPFLVMYRTKRGPIEQVLVNTLAPEEAWALSSTSEDRWMRNTLIKSVGISRALAALGALYPKGSCADEFNRRVKASAQRKNEFDAENSDHLDSMAKEAAQWALDNLDAEGNELSKEDRNLKAASLMTSQ